MPVRRLNHAVLYVRDLARAVSFYRGTLGLEVRTEVPGRAAFLRSPDSVRYRQSFGSHTPVSLPIAARRPPPAGSGQPRPARRVHRG